MVELTGMNRTIVLGIGAFAGVIIAHYAIHYLKQEGIGGLSLSKYR